MFAVRIYMENYQANGEMSLSDGCIPDYYSVNPYFVIIINFLCVILLGGPNIYMNQNSKGENESRKSGGILLMV